MSGQNVSKTVAKQHLRKFTAAITSCGPVGKAYGDCILANYQAVSKDMCQAEFLRFKECVQKKTGKKW